MTSSTPAGEGRLKEVLAVPEEKKKTFDFPTIAAMDGYGANYLDLGRGDIIPLLGHLFYAADGSELHRLEPTHPAYKKLGFALEGSFSFPYHGDVVQNWYERVSEAKERGLVPSERYPNYAYDIFRGNKIIVRSIRRRSDDATSRARRLVGQSPDRPASTAAAGRRGRPRVAHVGAIHVAGRRAIPAPSRDARRRAQRAMARAS